MASTLTTCIVVVYCILGKCGIKLASCCCLRSVRHIYSVCAIIAMLTSRVPVFVLLFLLITFKGSTGFEKDNPISDDDYSDANSGSGQSTCTIMNNDHWDDAHSNYSDCFLHHELVGLTSNGMINITTDVILPSIVTLSGLENFTIIGNDNPTLNCDNAGGIHFDSCHNSTIIGIKWERCGNNNDNRPAIKLYNSSNISIQNCSFQNSETRSIALSEMSGNVTIKGCTFAINNYYEDHGVAIYYLSKIQQHSKLQLTISNCNFTHNGVVDNQSIVYIGPSHNKITEHIFFTNLVFLDNQGTPIYISHQNVFITGNMLFKRNVAKRGGGIFINNHTTLTFHGSFVNFINNKAWYGGAVCLEKCSNSVFDGKSIVTIINNTAKYNGGAVYIEDNSDLTFEGNSKITISNNQADDGGAIYIQFNSNSIFAGNLTIIINENNATDDGGAIYINDNSNFTFEGNSTVTINNNIARSFGGAVYIRGNSDFTFEGNSIVTINENQARNGGAIFIASNSKISFEGSTKVAINDNQANAGSIYILFNSNLMSAGNSTVIINNNNTTYTGGAVFIKYNSGFTFKGNSTLAIYDNQVDIYGGAVYITRYSVLKFEGNSIVTIDNNQAKNWGGGAICIRIKCVATFDGNSTITINNNQANYGGALYINENSHIKFDGNSKIIINNNQADYGGAIYIQFNSNLTSEGNSTVIINNNKATIYGGALYINDNSDFIFEGNSTLRVYNSQAVYGGAIYITDNSVMKFTDNSTVAINNNQAFYGGAIYTTNSDIRCERISTIIINNNNAAYFGGAVYIWLNSYVKFEGHCVVAINNNQANKGGAFYIRYNCDATIEGNSIVTINNNQANEGGAVYIWDNSNAIFEGNSIVTINNNIASYDGGAFIIWYSDVMFKGNTIAAINNNQAINGGAIHTQLKSSTVFHGSSVVTFDNNTASADGGALHAYNNCSVKVKGNSTIIFNNNQALGDGGAIYLNNQINVLLENYSTVTLFSNTADNYGGAIYSTITQITKYFTISEFKFSHNRAKEAGNLMYIDVPKLCTATCLIDLTVGISNNMLWNSLSDRLIATSPKTLRLHYPAKCISNDSVGCEKYYIDNIMLGQEITIPTCLLDYYNRPAEVTQFTIIGEDHQNYYVYGSQYILISCNQSIEEISIIGNESIISSVNYSIFLTSHISSKRKTIFMNLTVELSPCHPGFLYQSKLEKCECYNNIGIVYCSGSSSAIKRGYWFGHVTGIPTVTFCPISYCNFTCCKTTTGYHQLSPTRNNQCRQHRAGIACGSCENGYTLPYYSSECVSIDKCTITWTIVIVILTVLYWVAIIAVVFIMMHYQINIGKLYAITYYYSIVDALLRDNSDDFSDGLYTFINIMYSIAKLTPQFLGKLCLVKGISGIDQQFIHYIHPLAVAFILIMITLLARCSHRISSLLSKAIIRVICFLLLLSYTSVTTTSLLLLKYLKFSDVTKVYTHLSPDTEYFHGRHLAYGMIAILCTITVVIGLPLLLLLEPFINHKINFTKIKPILDQFQGCYKDKYRWFAAYYMICRLMIISVSIVFTSNDFTAQYLLITVCAVTVLVHLMIKPYNSNVLNIFDAILLLLLMLTTVLLLIDFTESNLTIQVTLLLLILPLMIVAVTCVLAYKESIKRVLISLFNKVDNEDSNNNIEMPSKNFNLDIIIDNNIRKNVTVCQT